MQCTLGRNRPNRNGCDLPLQNEDWQFKNPIAKGEIIGRWEREKRMKEAIPKGLKGIIPQEEKIMTNQERVEKVAEMIKSGMTYREMADELNYKSEGSVSKLVAEAKEQGLISPKESTSEEETIEATNEIANEAEKDEEPINLDSFTEVAVLMKAKADKCREHAERMNQAHVIAKAIDEFLGESGQDLIERLFMVVCP